MEFRAPSEILPVEVTFKFPNDLAVQILLLKDCYHEVNGPHHGLKIYTSPKRGRTPPWVKRLQVHEVNGPHYGLKIYTSPKRGRTPPWVKNLYES